MGHALGQANVVLLVTDCAIVDFVTDLVTDPVTDRGIVHYCSQWSHWCSPWNVVGG